MSGLFGSTLIKGTKITDFSGTSAEVGRAIPFGYGAFPVDGFIGWAPLPPVEHRQVKRQGKGGVKQETFTYTLSYGVWFCKGTIYGIKWIKRNGKVVYTTDPNAPLEDREYAAKWAQRVNFHWGTRDQLPDSLIESYEGVGNVSGFPDSFYFTIEDEDVTDNGGAPPNYEACVIATPPEAYLTSKPYPQYFESSARTSAAVDSVTLYDLLKETELAPDEAQEAVTFRGGMLVVNLPNQFADVSSEQINFTGGKLSVPPVAYIDDTDEEEVTFTGGALVVAPVGNPDPDEVNETVSFMGGQLRVP